MHTYVSSESEFGSRRSATNFYRSNFETFCRNSSDLSPEGFAVDRVDQAQHKTELLANSKPKRGRPKGRGGRGRGRGCGRGRADGRGKPEAAAKSKQTKPKSGSEPKSKAVQKATSAESLQTPARKRKTEEEEEASAAKSSAAKHDRKPPEAKDNSKPGEAKGNSKSGGAVGKSKSGEPSFARRVRPKQEPKSMRWEAIRDAFKATIHEHVIAPSRHEDSSRGFGVRIKNVIVSVQRFWTTTRL